MIKTPWIGFASVINADKEAMSSSEITGVYIKVKNLSVIVNTHQYVFYYCNMEVIKNNMGGSKLLYQDYMYTRKDVNKCTMRWECSQRSSKSCNGTITTDLQEVNCSKQFDVAMSNKLYKYIAYLSI